MCALCFLCDLNTFHLEYCKIIDVFTQCTEMNYYSYYLHTTKYYLDWLKRGTESRGMQHAI